MKLILIPIVALMAGCSKRDTNTKKAKRFKTLRQAIDAALRAQSGRKGK